MASTRHSCQASPGPPTDLEWAKSKVLDVALWLYSRNDGSLNPSKLAYAAIISISAGLLASCCLGGKPLALSSLVMEIVQSDILGPARFAASHILGSALGAVKLETTFCHAGGFVEAAHALWIEACNVALLLMAPYIASIAFLAGYDMRHQRRLMFSALYSFFIVFVSLAYVNQSAITNPRNYCGLPIWPPWLRQPLEMILHYLIATATLNTYVCLYVFASALASMSEATENGEPQRPEQPDSCDSQAHTQPRESHAYRPAPQTNFASRARQTHAPSWSRKDDGSRRRRLFQNNPASQSSSDFHRWEAERPPVGRTLEQRLLDRKVAILRIELEANWRRLERLFGHELPRE